MESKEYPSQYIFKFILIKNMVTNYSMEYLRQFTDHIGNVTIF